MNSDAKPPNPFLPAPPKKPGIVSHVLSVLWGVAVVLLALSAVAGAGGLLRKVLEWGLGSTR